MTHNLFLPRGIRNNNPGNIRLTKRPWVGEVRPGFDRDFACFTTPVMGLRALMRLLLTYYIRHGLDTIESIVNRYAPPHENATDHYINHVCRHMEAGRRQILDLKDRAVLVRMAEAIVIIENGFPPKDMPAMWYLPKLYMTAADLALAE